MTFFAQIVYFSNETVSQTTVLTGQTNTARFVYDWYRFVEINGIFFTVCIYARIIWMYELLNVQCKPEKKMLGSSHMMD